MEVPNAFYRTSVKALVLNSDKQFLLCKEIDGTWELPGGGLDFGENPQEGLVREIREEMSLEVASIAETPSYFVTAFFERNDVWKANVLYETELENLDFKASDECIEIAFFTADQIVNSKIPVIPTVYEFAKVYKPENHE
ncbi:MAG: NUDIX hydrolase [Candidatus Pacebacteria bacterium]|nr:NUDIX hydrolase [Candidatus Paceibacterota bacterium]